jgi:hypothetical protein
MVMWRTARADGTFELRRRAFEAKEYTFPDDNIPWLHNLGQTFHESRTTHDGSLSSWNEIDRFERGGKQWVVLQEPLYEYAAELEIKPNGDIGEIIPVAPERAYEIAKRRDPPGVIYE